MAKKKETVSLIESLAEFKELKNINKETMLHVLADSFKNVLSKMYGTSSDIFQVIINAEKGDFEIFRNREVVSDDAVEDAVRQIGLSEAKKVIEDIEIGEELTEEVDFNSFGRRAVINLRQALSSKILELQKENIYHYFHDKIGEIISAEVYQVWKKEVLLLDDDGNELLLPKSEQIPGDYFRKGDLVQAVIEKVENNNNNPKIIISRSSGEFLKRLLELNVPEIADGIITIKAVARVPGERAKIAVESYDDRIDPVGACVGVNGSRIRGVVKELRGENIDVSTYTSNKLLFIQRALSPAKVNAITLDEELKQAEVYMSPEQVPLAIGKNASNLKLASILTGYKLEVFRDGNDDTEEDIYLDEFADEIDEWVLDILKNIGCTTAKSVLRKSREELIAITDLEDSTIDNVIKILESEFIDDQEEDQEDNQ